MHISLSASQLLLLQLRNDVVYCRGHVFCAASSLAWKKRSIAKSELRSVLSETLLHLTASRMRTKQCFVINLQRISKREGCM